jgi:hypothetical protein
MVKKNATTQREFLLQSILILDEQRRSMIEEQPSCAVSLSAFVGRKQNPNQILKSQSVTCQRCWQPPIAIRISAQRRRAFLDLQLDHSRFRSEDKERRDMNENSSEINNLCAPGFPSHPMQKEKLDQKDGASEARWSRMTETSNNVAFRDQIPGKMCSRERLAAAKCYQLLHPSPSLQCYLSCKAVVYSFDP